MLSLKEYCHTENKYNINISYRKLKNDAINITSHKSNRLLNAKNNNHLKDKKFIKYDN